MGSSYIRCSACECSRPAADRMAQPDARRACEACGLRGGRGNVIPWNSLVRARTHEGASVYLCPDCKTPLERSGEAFVASPAAAAAFRASDKTILEFEVPLTTPPATTHDGLLPVMCDDGAFRLFEWPEEGLDEPLVRGMYAALELSQKVPRSTPPDRVERAKQILSECFVSVGGLPPPERAVRDWEDEPRFATH